MSDAISLTVFQNKKEQKLAAGTVVGDLILAGSHSHLGKSITASCEMSWPGLKCQRKSSN